VDQSNNEIYVANYLQNSIQVYDRLATSGSAAKRSITNLSRPSALFYDAANSELYVANLMASSIAVYDRTASGAATAKRTLSGALTLLGAPTGVALSAAGELYVANNNDDSISAYTRTAANNTAPLRTPIKGATTTLSSVNNLAFDDGNDQIIVASQGGASIVAFAKTASGNSSPVWILQGASTGLAMPAAITVDTTTASGGEIYVTNTSSITVYGAKHATCGAPCTPLNVSPSRTVTSSSLSGAAGVALCN
jgi:DNA-binding beta-propeller fold protein YncE